MLETRGRLSGRPVTTAVGFVEGDEPGTLHVAAGVPYLRISSVSTRLRSAESVTRVA